MGFSLRPSGSAGKLTLDRTLSQIRHFALFSGMALLGSGCASMYVNSMVEARRHQTEVDFGHLEADPSHQPYRLVCPNVCDGPAPSYLVAGSRGPLYLVFPADPDSGTALLTAKRPSCSRSASQAPPLDLVVATTQVAFAPSDSGDHPTLALMRPNLWPITERRQETFEVLHGTTLLYSRDGTAKHILVDIDIHDFARRMQTLHTAPIRCLYLLSVPLDILASPLYLVVGVPAYFLIGPFKRYD